MRLMLNKSSKSNGSPLIDLYTLETFCSSVEEFADTFCKKIELLRPHSFIATQQASFYASHKVNLKRGEFLVTVDFSENFARCCPRVSLE